VVDLGKGTPLEFPHLLTLAPQVGGRLVRRILPSQSFDDGTVYMVHQAGERMMILARCR
jgi:hypothetical protein